MPSPSNHLSLATEYVESVRRLAAPDMCRPVSLLAYYAVMHLFEAMYAEPVKPLKKAEDFHSHRRRIAFAEIHMPIFGEKPVKALKSLYDFSYMARYICVDTTPLHDPLAQPSSAKVDLDRALPKTQANLEQIVGRLNRIIEKTTQLLTPGKYAKEFALLRPVVVPALSATPTDGALGSSANQTAAPSP